MEKGACGARRSAAEGNVDGRLDYRRVVPAVADQIAAVSRYLTACGIEPALRHLVWLRVSQLNGCAYCVDLHTQAALRDRAAAA